MKLCATIMSERGKPVQKTGNEFIEITIRESNRNLIYTVDVESRDDEISLILNNEITGEKVIMSVPQQ